MDDCAYPRITTSSSSNITMNLAGQAGAYEHHFYRERGSKGNHWPPIICSVQMKIKRNNLDFEAHPYSRSLWRQKGSDALNLHAPKYIAFEVRRASSPISNTRSSSFVVEIKALNRQEARWWRITSWTRYTALHVCLRTARTRPTASNHTRSHEDTLPV